MKKVSLRPRWLDKKINFADCSRVSSLLKSLRLNTVCQQALCPNIGECFARKEATFLILGKNCTRSCSFCRVEKNSLPQAPDFDEPGRVAQAVKKLNLRHAVITSVTRDDLADGGAGHFADTILHLRRVCPGVSVEVLIPDFKFNPKALAKILKARPEIIAHNLETVSRLYGAVRKGSDYKRSLGVLKFIKEKDKYIFTKSGLMLGLGEREDEVLSVFADLRKASCDFLSLGQYLSPSRNHHPVIEYIPLEKFLRYKKEALKSGFLSVASGPYVRSSYLAKDYLESVYETKSI
jgi:lipoic acid synthetase